MYQTQQELKIAYFGGVKELSTIAIVYLRVNRLVGTLIHDFYLDLPIEKVSLLSLNQVSNEIIMKIFAMNPARQSQ